MTSLDQVRRGLYYASQSKEWHVCDIKPAGHYTYINKEYSNGLAGESKHHNKLSQIL